MRGFLRWAAMLLVAGRAWPAVPVLEHLYPVALRPGTTNEVESVGKVDPWPPKVWVDAPGIHIRPGTNSGTLQVVVAPDAPSGTHFVRLYDDEGASAPHFLLVDPAAALAEAEPNDAFQRPQVVTNLPVVIDGRISKGGDVDCYAVRLEAGQTLGAAVQAHVLMSPIDAVLRLVDGQGITRAGNHDDGRSFDPRLAWTAPEAGTYVVQVFGFDYPAGSDVRFGGNSKCVYRLHLTAGPGLHHVLPLGVQRGARTRLTLHPYGPAPREASAEFDGSGLGPEVTEVEFRAPGFVNALRLPVGDGPEAVEHEPKGKATEAQSVTIPGAVSGAIDPGGDVDRYRFTARAGEAWTIAVQSAELGFPLDATLRIEDAAGKELARNEDADGADPRLDWTAPVGTNFVAVVSGLGRLGGPDHLYRLSFTRPVPGWKATVPESAFAVAAGATNTLKLTVTRRQGLTNPLTAAVVGLPKGLRAEAVSVGEKGGEVLLPVIAATNAVPWGGPVRIEVTDGITHRVQPAVMELVSGGENNGVPQGFRRLVRESIADLWLTVQPAPKPAEPKK